MFGELTNLFSGGQEKGSKSLMGNIEKGMAERQRYTTEANDALKQYGQQGIDARKQYGQQGIDALKQYGQQGIDAFRQYGQQANQGLQPYQTSGQGEINPYMQNYQRMLDPNKFINEQMSGYMESPWAKMQMAKGQNSIQNAASAGGGLGGTNYMADMGDYARNITAADQQNYLNNAMNVWNGGLGRQGEMVGMGHNASGQMGKNMMNTGNNIGNAYNSMGQGVSGNYGSMGQGIAGGYNSMGQGIAGNYIGLGNGMAEDFGNRGQAEMENQKSKAMGWQQMIGMATGALTGGFGGPQGFGGSFSGMDAMRGARGGR